MTWNLFCDRSKRREDWERSIFVRSKEGGYGLRENILFHLYVSTSPCGDARLHSPYEITADCKRTPSLSLASFLCLLSLFLVVLLCLWWFFFLKLLLALSLCWQKVFHSRVKALQAVECVCLCVQLVLGPVGWGRVCRENQSWVRLPTPGAPWLCWGIYPCISYNPKSK